MNKHRIPKIRLLKIVIGLGFILVVAIVVYFTTFSRIFWADVARKTTIIPAPKTMTIEPRLALAGKLIKEDNKPFLGKINLWSEEDSVSISTNDQGVFHFYEYSQELPPGEYSYSIIDKQGNIWASPTAPESQIFIEPKFDATYFELKGLKNYGKDPLVEYIAQAKASKKDTQRRADLDKLKTALVKYYNAKTASKELPATDGWIELDKTKGSVAKALLSGDFITGNIPCDPDVSAEICQTTAVQSYMYYRDDYCGGSKTTFSLYTRLGQPTDTDKKTIENPAIKCNSKVPKDYKMNYRVGEMVTATPTPTPATPAPKPTPTPTPTPAPVPASNTTPKITQLDKKLSCANWIYCRLNIYTLVASWKGEDKEDKASLLVYRYKIGNGSWTNWAITSAINKLVVGQPAFVVEVKDTKGLVGQALK